jgi:hypothetical protein
VRAFRSVQPDVFAFTAVVQGTTLPSTGSAMALGYDQPQWNGTTKAHTSGYPSWSPPV